MTKEPLTPVDMFEESDVFSPEAIVMANEQNEKVEQVTDDVLARYYLERKRAYANVFSTGDTEEWALDFVMRDMAEFCRAYKPTWNKDQKVQDLLEGRREVYNRIADFSRLSRDQLLAKYENAKYQ